MQIGFKFKYNYKEILNEDKSNSNLTYNIKNTVKIGIIYYVLCIFLKLTLKSTVTIVIRTSFSVLQILLHPKYILIFSDKIYLKNNKIYFRNTLKKHYTRFK